MIMPALKREPRSMERILLILDLDETLIRAVEHPLDRPADFRLPDFHVYRRPHLDAFLALVSEHFDLAVWSTGNESYVDAIVNAIFPDVSALQFCWNRSRAIRRTNEWGDGFMDEGREHLRFIKPLEKVKRLGWNLDRVLVVDDTPAKLERSYGNAIYPVPYMGAEDDRELELLGKYLLTLRDEPNMRRIEKRTWRNAIFE